MNLPEKSLYQQIHPVRLFSDWAGGFTACYFFWQHDLVAGIIVAFIPSLIVSLIVVKFTDLQKLKNSTFGRYHKRIYNKTIDLARLGGFIVMASGSWYQSFEIAGAGLAIIIWTWMYGLFTKK